jgi:hypothetical protein
MKRTFIVFALLLLPLSLNSQSPQPNKPPLTILQELKAANKALIEKQQATLQKLDELEKNASQLKIIGKRS